MFRNRQKNSYIGEQRQLEISMDEVIQLCNTDLSLQCPPTLPFQGKLQPISGPVSAYRKHFVFSVDEDGDLVFYKWIHSPVRAHGYRRYTPQSSEGMYTGSNYVTVYQRDESKSKHAKWILFLIQVF